MKRIVLLFLFTMVFTPFSSSVSIEKNVTASGYIPVEGTLIERNWSNLPLIYKDKYHDIAEMLSEIQLVASAAPDLVDISVIGQSVEGRDIHCLRVTNEVMTNPKASALFIAQHHAREQITVEASLRFLFRLINSYGLDPQITNFINTMEIFIIPTLNPDGLEVVVGENNEWLRKNLRQFDDDGDGLFDEDPLDDVNDDGLISEFSVYEKSGDSLIFIEEYTEGIDNDGDGLVNEDIVGGVDLNRNYGYRWNDSLCTDGSTSDTRSYTFPGTAPFSEPETAALRDFLEDRKFAAAMSLHSGINATYFPWSSEYGYAEASLYSQVYTDIRNIVPSRFFGYAASANNLAVKNKITSPSTLAGEWSDWMYTTALCKLPMTFEIYHNISSHNGGTTFIVEDNATHQVHEWTGMYGYFAPEESYIDPLWNDVQPAFDYWLDITPRLEHDINYINITSINSGDTLVYEISLDIENLSPRLDTMERIYVVDSDYNQLQRNNIEVWIESLSEGETRTAVLEFELPSNLLENDVTVKIGNDYVGFYDIVLEAITDSNTSTLTTTTGQLSTAGLLITPLISVLAIVAVKCGKKRNKL